MNDASWTSVQTQQPTQPQVKVQQPGAGAFGGLGGLGGGGMHRPTGSIGQQNIFGGATATTTMKPTPMGTMGGASTMVPTPMLGNTPSPVPTTPGQQQQQQQKKPAAGGGFDDLWNMSLATSGKGGSSGQQQQQQQQQGQGKSIKDLEKEKSMAGLWGSTGTQARPNAAGGGNGSMSGAGFGNFGGSAAGGGGASAGQGDDLLL